MWSRGDDDVIRCEAEMIIMWSDVNRWWWCNKMWSDDVIDVKRRWWYDVKQG
jgi:hypothetical protein